MLAREALNQLGRAAAARVVVVSRAQERACCLAERFGAQAAPLSALAALLPEADALLACSHAANGFLLDRRGVGPRRQRCLRIVDLGLPRNVDPDVASLPGVRLTQLERLHGFAAACPHAIAAADAIVAQELRRFEEWRQARVHRGEIAGWLREASAAPAQRRALHARIACLKAQVAA
jgi:glutamyl-tRNA reductase